MTNANEKIVLEVVGRESTGKNEARRMRARGAIPGIVYGLDRPPFKVSVDPERIEKVLRLESGVNTVFNLVLKGESKQREAMIKELQRDPVTERALHVDFVRVDLTKAVQVRVPIVLVGTAEGVKNEGGIMDFVQREVQVECLPGNIPEHFDVDVSDLHVNQHVSLKDLRVPEGVEILGDPDQVVAGVTPPRVEEKPEAAAEVGAEPGAVEGAAEHEAAGKPSEETGE